jgi:hypothetical protein
MFLSTGSFWVKNPVYKSFVLVGCLVYNLSMPPKFLKKYFWDIDFEKSDPKSHSEYFIKRILEFGNRKSFEWLKDLFGMKEIRRVVKLKKLSSKSQNFWQNV